MKDKISLFYFQCSMFIFKNWGVKVCLYLKDLVFQPCQY